MNRTQHGSALLMGLTLLLVLTIIGVSAVKLGTINLRIATNMEDRRIAEDLVQDAIEQVLSDPANFTTNNVTLTFTGQDGATITVAPRQCIAQQPVTGYSTRFPAPADTYWRITGTYTSPHGSQITIVQGARIQLPLGNC